MANAAVWYGLFAVLLLCYLAIQLTVKDRRRYFIYFLAGAVFGFYFDIFSFANGYYSYPDFYKLTLFGLPVSMTLAEGFSVAITIYLYEFIRTRLSARKSTAA
ncbi:hypothetical protein HYY73_04475 [Candidatus Woesearchaeota archaeon]|nr:hypothetical protein [Candidatus Woesearchaeota archaeon]